MLTILKNGKIYIEKGLFAEALLIEDGIIKAYGSNEEILDNKADEIIDLEGKTVLPGFNDSHMHLAGVGATMTACILNSSKSIDDIVQLGREFLEDNKDISAMPGRGWNQDYFTTGENRLINRHDLDKISTDIPIVFTRVCGHVATGNTKALEILGVDENSHVAGGEILLGEDGKPNGVFTENAVKLIQGAIPAKTAQDKEKDFLTAAEHAISMGITSVQSNDVGSDAKDMFEVIKNIYDNKKTKLRYGHQFNFQNIDDLKEYLEGEHHMEYDEKFLSKGALKLFIDGSLGARTALMLEDYHDAPGVKGVEVIPADELDELCALAAENNIRIATHAIGDGAVESILNAYEKIIDNGYNKLRHGIVHNQITSMEQLERMAGLKIAVMYQPIFLDYDIQIVEDRVGKELASTSYAFNTLFKLGAPISIGTDAPVESFNPFPNIYCAVNRLRLNEEPAGGFYPNEKMELEDVIDCYTLGSAYNEFKEDFKGRLKPGYVADLIVLDSDIFTIDSLDIKDIQVEKTMIDGSFVFERN